MKINFDKDKFLKLLKQEKILKDQGKLLSDYDETKKYELIKYLGLLENQIFWKNRNEYIEMLDSFIKKKISLDQFFQQFSRLYGLNRKDAQKWKKNLEEEIFVNKSNEIDIEINPKSYKFTKIISDLHSSVDLCDPDVSLQMNLEYPESLSYALSEDFLRLIIENDILPKLKKYYKKS